MRTLTNKYKIPQGMRSLWDFLYSSIRFYFLGQLCNHDSKGAATAFPAATLAFASK